MKFILPTFVLLWRSHELSSVLLAPGTRSKFINVNEVFLKRSHSSGTASCLENPSQTLLIVALTRRYMEGTVTRLVESNSTVKFSNLLARGIVTLRTIFIDLSTSKCLKIDIYARCNNLGWRVAADKHGSRPTLDLKTNDLISCLLFFHSKDRNSSFVRSLSVKLNKITSDRTLIYIRDKARIKTMYGKHGEFFRCRNSFERESFLSNRISRRKVLQTIAERFGRK